MTAHIKPAPTRTRGLARVAAWLALTTAFAALAAGACLIALGGYSLLAHIFGHGDQLAFPWWPIIPGMILFWGVGGCVGQWAADVLDL